MLEANKLWLYSLLFSVFWGLNDIIRPKTVRSESERVQTQRVLNRRLITDIFDIFIPGHVTRWIRTGPVFVGIASAVSTLLSSRDIWERLR